jgi:UTP:GlnB (protein PII) uridylyltransferase
MREIDGIEVVYLAMLYHDIGKGLGGDHSNKGAVMVRATAARFGLNADDAAELDLLVRHHLTMHQLATRRDIHDPKLISDFVRTVGTLATLQKLYVLTFADLGATNPKLWNSWQHMLLTELYTLTVEDFERARTTPVARSRSGRRIGPGHRAAARIGRRDTRPLPRGSPRPLLPDDARRRHPPALRAGAALRRGAAGHDGGAFPRARVQRVHRRHQ